MACRKTGRARSGWSWRRSVSSAVTGSTIRITVDSLEAVAGASDADSVRPDGRRGPDGLADELPAGGRIAPHREGLGGGKRRGVGAGRHLTLAHEQGRLRSAPRGRPRVRTWWR